MEKFAGQIKLHNKEHLEEKFPSLNEETYTESLCAFAQRIFTEENKVGFGKTADVFKYPEEDKDICFKNVHNMLPGNNDIDTEIEFMDDLHNLDEYVRVPEAFATIVSPMKLKMEKGQRVLFKDHVIVMEYIDGCTLEETLTNRELIPEGFDATGFFDKLENFIKKMHEKKIYHRDLHHKNVMIERSTGNPVVIDFGRAGRSYMTDESENDIYSYEEIEGSRTVKKVLPNDNTYLQEMRKQYEEYLTDSKITI